MDASAVAVVWNPSKIEREVLEKAFADAVGESALDVLWLETSPDDPGKGAARRALAAGSDLVIAAGGDGTVRAVAEALAGSGVPLGIVPQGTGNLLARNLKVPLGDVAAAFERAFGDDESRAIDMGWVDVEADGSTETHGFVVMVGFGIDAQMLAETNDDLKAKAGWLAYVEALGRAVTASEVIEATLTVDDGSPEQVSAHTLLVANCGELQGGVTLFPDATPDDGELDMLVISSDGALQWLDTMRSFVWDNGIRRLFTPGQSAASTDTVQHGKATSVRVELPEPQPFEIDGEEVGEVSAFTARIDAGALLVR